MAKKVKFEWQKHVLESDLPAMTKHVLIAGLSLRMTPYGGDCHPSQETISEDCGISERSVQRHLKRAKEEGFLDWEQKKKEGRGWRLRHYFPRFSGNKYPQQPDTESPRKEEQPDTDSGRTDRQPDTLSKGGDTLSSQPDTVSDPIGVHQGVHQGVPKEEQPDTESPRPKNGQSCEDDVSVSDWSDEEVINSLRKGFISEQLEQELMHEADKRNLAI